MTVEAFGIEKEFLHDLLKQVRTGRIQLPDFQRGWVWPHRGITGLLASISLGYPVGTLMTLQAGGDARFKQRPLEGAAPTVTKRADRLLLDGQQRMTSLFQALMLGEAVQTRDDRGKSMSGWFYADIQGVLDSSLDRDEAIRFIPADKRVRDFRGQVLEDYSDPAKEYEGQLFPLVAIFDHNPWMTGYFRHWKFAPEHIQLWTAFTDSFIKRFEQYLIPVIELGRDTPREAVCQVFEKVNTGGVTLTVFELLTATYAADDFDLRRDWAKIRGRWNDQQHRLLGDVQPTDLLQAVTLLATQARRQAAIAEGADSDRAPRIGCRRSDILGLSLEEYRQWVPKAVAGLLQAVRFLHKQCIYDTKFLPYGSQLIALAAIFATLGAEAEGMHARARIGQWYWSGVFGELYGGTTEGRIARDLPEVVAWVRGQTEENPRTVRDARFLPERLTTLRTRNSAAYKGLYSLLLKAGASDWRTGDTVNAAVYFDDAIDIHHVFPKAWCEDNGIPVSEYDSIVNKTPLSARTNRIIGGHAPSEYLQRLANSGKTEIPLIGKHVVRHMIDVDLLQSDDFEGFFEHRRSALIAAIENAMAGRE
ncbi:DUF262 domain-containing protein [Planotetraspora sp. A-T 1434]|uniref:DUF262 domain-containing protein n=1 Tax=Planotetraspora sp. A-T 1434 TaxID=2979219 RepID=UPI0021C23F64|nr:DUF262 domain-containing protein [Planotetraspora sp. A-T 1434]MCT9933315.1 DUF262 domain-containing protein [Planotetraspora sp. A-T 1434]